MTIAEEINDLKNRVSQAFDACEEKSATMPQVKTTHTLASTIRSIPTGGGGKVIDIPQIEILQNNGDYVKFKVHSVEGADVYYYRVLTQQSYDNYNGLDSALLLYDFSFEWKPIQPDTNIQVDYYGMGGYYGLCKIQVIAGDSATGSFSDPTATTATVSGILVYCFDKDTDITLAGHTTKKISEIDYDDDILVWNFDEGKQDKAKPVWIQKRQLTGRYIISTFDDGTIFKNMGRYGHRVFSLDENKFVYVVDAVGHRILKDDGSAVKLVKNDIVDERCEFYNLITHTHLNCYCNHLLASTHFNNLYPIQNMKFIKPYGNPKYYHNIEDFIDIDSSYVEGFRSLEQSESLDDVRRYLMKCYLRKK